jgi:hypothetical protein
MPLHRYWQDIGNPLLFTGLLFFIAFVAESGWTFINWKTLQEWRQLETTYLEDARHVEAKNG